MPVAAIALGSNLSSRAGGRSATLTSAVDAVRLLGSVAAVSTFFETEPVGYADQPPFLNAALLLRTELAPLPLLRALLLIEQQHGRDRSHGILKGPRTLDLDLLLYDSVALSTNELVLPHPEMHRRRFVLEPLTEIAPAMMHPVLQHTVARLLADLH